MSASVSESPCADPSTRPPDSSPIETETLGSHNSDEKSSSDQVETNAGGEEGAEEEEGECGFCLFMKAGGCRDTFSDWEKCMEEAEKSKEDIVDKCYQAAAALKKCMEAHSNYYEPILRAEKAAEEEAVKELEREAAAKEAEQSSSAKPASEEAVKELEREAAGKEAEQSSSAKPASEERINTLEAANE
ncbi:GCK domain-containing protein [Psidium guajava]|nr:GCK domain-containing protein [Psidium guajava]